MNIQQLMSQAKKMQSDVEKIEKQLKETQYFASSGGDAVRVTISGGYKINNIELADDLLSDKEMTIELLQMAINDALNQIKSDKEEKMGKLTGGLSLPGGF